MKAIELLEKYPKAAEVIINYYAEEFLRAVENTDVPEEFKEFAKQQRIDDQYVADFIDNNPRGAFDVFDAHRIYIITLVAVQDIGYFNFEIRGDSGVMWYQVQLVDSRKEAETAAIEKAFEILNEKL